MTTQNEQQVVPGKRLGRRTPSNKPALMLADFLTGAVPDHSDSVDHFSKVPDFALYGNDRFGDCGPVSGANSRKLTTKYLTGTEVSPTENDVFDLYRRSGNPNFDPNTGADDNGVDMQTMCEALVSGGIGGVKALGFAKVDVSNVEELEAAVDIFGFLLLGVNLETAQQSQPTVWDYSPSSEWGGHAVLTGKYGANNRLEVVTWAEIVAMTTGFMQHQLEEAWVVIWPEHLTDNGFRAGVDMQAFAAAYQEITGKKFPVPIPAPPAPAPTPAPTPDPTPTPTPTPTPPPTPAPDPTPVPPQPTDQLTVTITDPQLIEAITYYAEFSSKTIDKCVEYELKSMFQFIERVVGLPQEDQG